MANQEHLDHLQKGSDYWNLWREQYKDFTPDFTKAYFHGADLRSVNFEGANLENSDLSAADLDEANLVQANLVQANLKEANLSHSDSRGAIFTGANLIETDFHGATLDFADFSETKLEKADFEEASLQSVNLKGINLKEANFHRADLFAAKLNGSNLTEATFHQTNLRFADLSNANLRNANLSKVDLYRANFNEANLSEANISKADLSGNDLRKADLRGARLQATNLISSNLEGANLTGAFLWEIQKSGWNIKDVVCENVYWDEKGEQLTEYGPGEFERAFAERPQIELEYKNGISLIELAMLPLVIEKLQNDYEGLELQIRSVQDDGGKAKVRITLSDSQNRSTKEFEKALNDIKDRLIDSKNLVSTYKDQNKNLSNLVNQLHAKISQIANPELQSSEMLTVLFLDLTGFSRKTPDEQLAAMNFTRHSAQGLCQSFPNEPHLGKYINTWGDAIVVGFENPDSGIEFAIQLLEILKVKEIKARIGMGFGKFTLTFNPNQGKLAPEGPAMSEAARLEPLAQPEEILISPVLRAHGLDEEKFTFTKTERELKKPVGALKTNDTISCYSVAKKETA